MAVRTVESTKAGNGYEECKHGSSFGAEQRPSEVECNGIAETNSGLYGMLHIRMR